MADYAYSQINISGAVTAVDVLDRLVGCAKSHDVRINPDKRSAASINEIYAEILRACDECRPAFFYNNMALNGEFAELQAFCRERGLSYHVEWSSSDDLNPGVLSYMPGMSSEVAADTSGNSPIITLDDVLPFLDLPGDEISAALREHLDDKILAAGIDLPKALSMPPEVSTVAGGHMAPASSLRNE